VYAEKIAKEKRKLIARKEKECVQRRKEAAKKAKEKETQQEQDRNDCAIALRLFKNHYKDEFDKRGKSVARHRQGKLEKQLERNFERMDQLDEDEVKEWVALIEDAKKGDKEKQNFIDDNNYVNELKRLCYIPAKWLPGLDRQKTRCGHVSQYLKMERAFGEGSLPGFSRGSQLTIPEKNWTIETRLDQTFL
jgi:hypothetical protein